MSIDAVPRAGCAFPQAYSKLPVREGFTEKSPRAVLYLRFKSLKEQGVDVRLRRLGRRRRPVADQHRSVCRVERRQSATAAHQGRVEWDDVEQRPEPQLLAGQPLEPPQFGEA